MTVLSNDLTNVKPLERRPDSVLMAEWLIDDPAGRYIMIIESALTLAEITEAGLGETAGQQKWRDLMTKQLIPYVSEFRRQGIEEGRAVGRAVGLAEGRARAILQVLDKRGIAVDDDARQQIVSCTDLDTLTAWLDRSLAAAQVSDLFV